MLIPDRVDQLLDLGLGDTAFELEKQLVQRVERFGPFGSRTACIRLLLARALLDLGRRREGLLQLRTVVAEHQVTLAPTHPNRLESEELYRGLLDEITIKVPDMPGFDLVGAAAGCAQLGAEQSGADQLAAI